MPIDGSQAERRISFKGDTASVPLDGDARVLSGAADSGELNEIQLARMQASAALQNAMILTDPRQSDNPIVYHNQAFEKLTGYTASEIDGHNCRFLQGAGTNQDDVARMREAITQERPIQITILDYKKDGTSFWNELTISPLRDTAGTLTHWVGLQTEVTALKTTELALHESEMRLRLALESGQLGFWLLDLVSRRYQNISAIWQAQFGLENITDFSQSDFFQILHPEDRDRVHEVVEQAIANRRDYEAEYRCVWPDGSVHWISAQATLITDASGQPVRMIGVTRNITERKQQEAGQEQALQEAQERADRDPLTNLWNHRAFHKRLEAEATRAQREGTTLAVVMLDLDNFKFFNDVYGHTMGDVVLGQVTAKLQSVCRPYDTLARFGGDEFALLLPGVGQASVREIQARLRGDLNDLVFQPDGQEATIPITIAIGVALFPGPGMDRTDVVRQADDRLRRDKAGTDGETEAEQIRLSMQNTVEGFSLLDALVTAVDNKDRYTRRHSEDVMTYSLAIAREMGLDKAAQHTVAMAALLHDVGKIGVPDQILRKPGPLTEAEFEAVKQHPQMGAVMVGAVPELDGTLDVVLAAVRHHHERWDGHGYPEGLRGEETPLIARLMAVADAFSAMTTDRPYRKGMSQIQALSILEAGAGTQWDAACVQSLAQMLRRLYETDRSA